MTNSKNSEEKTSNKNKVLNWRMAHKKNLKKSTRIDEENKKQNYRNFFLQIVHDFIDLSGTV